MSGDVAHVAIVREDMQYNELGQEALRLRLDATELRLS